MQVVTVLGAVKSRGADSQSETLTPNARQLLAIMVAAGPDGLSFERVADELWPNQLPATWDASLRMAFARLRKRLPVGCLTNKARWCRLELPDNAVDLWHLAAVAESPGLLTDIEDLVRHLAQEAFPNVEISPIIRDAINHFDLLRTHLLDRLIQQQPVISPLATEPLRSFAASRDWDTALASHVEQLTTDALRVPPSADTVSTATPMPASMARLRAQPLLGREAAVEQLIELAVSDNASFTVLSAAPKSGRSATLAEVGARLAATGWRIIHLEPSAPAAAFGPFLQALPDLREPLLAAMGSDASNGQIRSRCWASILHALDHPDVPTCVIVDDAELLDSNSEEALAFVGRSRTKSPLPIIVTADPTTAADSKWINAPRVNLEAVSLDTVREMIATVHPGSSDLHQAHLSEQIFAVAHGRAGLAFQLAQSADPAALTLEPHVATNNEPESAAIELSGEVLHVALAASVIRSPISLEDLEHVARSEQQRVLASVEKLLGLGILTETTRPDVFELAPGYQHSDFVTGRLPNDVARLSLRAMTLPGRGPIAVATDALRARPLISEDKLIASLLAAAESLASSQSYREAITYFQAAEDLGAELRAEALVTYATSLELVGADALAVRERAVALALANNQPGVALDAALTGLPRTEFVDGDPARAQLIESIDPAQLSRADRFRRQLALSRQFLLLSRRDDAKHEALAAKNLVESLEEEADVWLALAHIDRWLPTGTPETGFVATRFHSPRAVADPTRRARLQQAAAVAALVVGDFVTAAQEVAELATVAEQSEDPLRIWHSLILRSAILNNELRLDEAERVADEACDLGVSFALSGAVASRMAQHSNRSMLLGNVVNTVGRQDTATSEAMRSVLARAAACMHLARAGREVEAARLAESVLASSAGSRFEIGVAGLASHAVAAASPAARARIAEVLTPLRGTLLVVGAGLTFQGPVESLLANIADCDTEARELRHAAVELVDSWHSPIWQIVTRVHLGRDYRRAGRVAEERTYLGEAVERAAGTEFAIHERWGLFET